MSNSNSPLAILRLVTTVGETSSPYNQFSLALSGEHKTTLCSYFKATVSPPPDIALFEGDGSLKGFYRAMKAALNDKDYDIIHGHMAVTGFLFLLANLLYGKSLNSTVFTVHNCYLNHKFRNRLLLIPIFAFFQRVVCCGQASLESFPAFYKWLGGDRLGSIQNGVDMKRIDMNLKNQHPHPDSNRFTPLSVGFTVLSIGRLIKIKNPLTVLKAFQQSAILESHLAFIGDGNLSQSLTMNIGELDMDKQVELKGLIPRNKVYEALAQADVFISTSYGEGLPIAALEAMACRCPVILSDIQPHRELAGGADFIPLIPPDDIDGFAREISRLHNLPTEERKAIGEKCRAWAEDHFSLTKMHGNYLALYEQLAERSRWQG
jgi:Glycosyltransferase